MTVSDPQDMVRAPELSWSDCVFGEPRERATAAVRVMGVLPGEGIGPEVVQAALDVLDAIESVRPMGIRRMTGGAIGLAAEDAPDGRVTRETAAFCDELFERQGPIFCGPGGGRFVYDLRQKFDLFCKLAPLKPSRHLHRASRLRSEALADVDIMVVRDNAGGVYQGQSTTRADVELGTIAEQKFSYNQVQVERIMEVGARLARSRRGHMHVAIKEGGVPAISALWRQVGQMVAEKSRVECRFINADYAAYFMIQHAQEIDVLVTPNLVGDILADLGAVLLGSRGLTYSGNFSLDGRAVYQTGHGAAYDLAGTDRANPVAQMHALAMMLRESFRMEVEANLIEAAIEEVWRQGWRTDDLLEPGCRRAGLRAMAGLVSEAAASLARKSV